MQMAVCLEVTTNCVMTRSRISGRMGQQATRGSRELQEEAGQQALRGGAQRRRVGSYRMAAVSYWHMDSYTGLLVRIIMFEFLFMSSQGMKTEYKEEKGAGIREIQGEVSQSYS